jgi:ubiquinone/menaquinone biosynthesis C-methylase UbiE
MMFATSADKARFFDRWAPQYDWLFPSVLYQAVHQRLLDFVELPDQPQVLDLGCGTGKLLDRLATNFPTLEGTGLDLSEEMIRQAIAKNRYGSRLRYIQGRSDAIPLGDRQFDAVFSTISMAHYPELQPVFAELDRILKPGGAFYWVDPGGRKGGSGVWQIPITPGGFRVYSFDRREQLGATVGWSVRTHAYLIGPIVLTAFQKPSL